MDGKSEIRNQIYKILEDVTGIQSNEIDEDVPWYELDTVSFELVEFIVALRNAFNVNLTTKQLIKMNSLKDIIEYIYQQTKS